jgi:putative DNA-invertase from lambdoid prophage Rac
MKLLTVAQRAQLIDNGRRQAAVKGTPNELDFKPVVKLFNPCGAVDCYLTLRSLYAAGKASLRKRGLKLSFGGEDIGWADLLAVKLGADIAQALIVGALGATLFFHTEIAANQWDSVKSLNATIVAVHTREVRDRLVASKAEADRDAEEVKKLKSGEQSLRDQQVNDRRRAGRHLAPGRQAERIAARQLTDTTLQASEHQLTQAQGAGFQVDRAIFDHGVSGVSTRLEERPEGRRLFDVLRHGDVLVVRWIDRLGRNYDDVTANIRRFMAMGVIVRTVINNMTFDGATADPMQKAIRDALIAFMAATAQAQAEATKAAQQAGIQHARAHGTRFGGAAFKGRKPTFTRESLRTVQDMLAQHATISAIAKATGLGRQTIYRIEAAPAAAEASLAAWETRAV